MIIGMEDYTSMIKWRDNAYSEEVYFGPDTSLAIALKNFVVDMRALYERSPYKTNTSKTVKDSKFIDELKRNLAVHEKAIAQAVNAKEVSIALCRDSNAACWPLSFDKDLIKKDKKPNGKSNYQYNEEYIKKLHMIVETRDGFKFKDSSVIHVCCIFGFGLFDVGLTDDEATAIMIHEFGHTFQHILVDIKTQVFCETRKEVITEMAENASLLNTLFSFGFNYLNVIAQWVRKKKMDKAVNNQPMIDQLAEQELIKGYKANEKDSLSGYMTRDDVGEFADNITDETAHYLENKNEESHNKIKKGFNIVEYIIGSLSALLYVPYATLKPLLSLLSGKDHIMRSNKKFLDKETRYEQFSDMTAASYGYGPYLASALIKMRKTSGAVDSKNLYLFNFLHYVPFVNVMIAWANWSDMRNTMLISGYPPDIQRYEGVYKALDYELQTNKNLKPEQKEAIQRDLDSIREIHHNYRTKGVKGMIMKLYYAITRKNIQAAGDKSKMYENVLAPLEEILNEAAKNK